MKIIAHISRHTAAALLLLGLITSCSKEDSISPQSEKNSNNIAAVLKDNYNFSVLYGNLNMVHLLDTLSGSGTYTVLAPENTGFSRYPYLVKQLQTLMPYTIVAGRITIGSLPLNTLQVYKTLGGGHVYITRYKDGNDTISTINGYKLVSKDNAASNGLVQVVPQVMNAELYATMKAQLQSDTTVTLFAAIIQQAGMNNLLDSQEPYTLLAPSNLALQQAARLGWGISSIDSILTASPQQLAQIVKTHLLKGRNFEGDLYRLAKANPDGITMEDGSKVKIGGNPTTFQSITFLGSGNNGQQAGIYTSPSFIPNINNANIPCGNGVIHIINRMLIP